MRIIRLHIIIDSRHVSPWAINMHRRGRDLDWRYEFFCIVDQPPPSSRSIKVTTQLFITSICFMKSQPRGVLFVPSLCTHTHRRLRPSHLGKIVLVNEIRLNHALAFHQSLCDGCSPLIHSFHPLRLLPVCADMSNDPLRPVPRWAVDLGDDHGTKDHPYPLPSLNTSVITHPCMQNHRTHMDFHQGVLTFSKVFSLVM